MTYRDRLELSLSYHAGSLDELEAKKVRALLVAGDPATVAASVEAIGVLARFSATVHPVQPRPLVREQLMAGLASRRFASAAGAGNGLALAAPDRPRSSTAAWRRIGIAAAIVVSSGVTYLALQADRNELRSRVRLAETTAQTQRERLADLQRALVAAEPGVVPSRTALAAMYSSDARFGELIPTAGDTSRRQGRVVFDSANRQVQVYLFDLVQPPSGRTYQLWLLPVDDAAPVPAPVFEVDSSGKAFLTTSLPPDVSAISGAAVSEEAAGGSISGKPDVVKLIGKAG